VWGANIDEIEWAAFLSAVVAATPSGGASPAAYFTEYLTATIEKVQQQGLQLAQDVLWKLLTDAILEGPQSIEFHGLEVEAAVATYMRSVNVPYPVIKAEKTIWITMPDWVKKTLES
jgi:fructose-1-phosphate kinase PfkB-like protein